MMEWLRNWENPVFIKEMRVGFREKKVFSALVAWVLIIALIASLMSLAAFNDHQNLDNLPEAGRSFLEGLFWLQLVLMAFLAPSLTTSAVSGERERKSFDMLLTTHLSPAELILGKFGFAASFILLAVCATVPLESVVFFLGGVSLFTFVTTKLIVLAFGLLSTLFGLMMSARETRSAYATGQTYLGLAFICFFGSFLLGGLRYQNDLDIVVYVGVWSFLAYLALFLFWKSVNNLEDRAHHVLVLLKIGLFYYIFMVCFMLFCQWYLPGFDGAAWAGSAPIHYLLFGVLLNPMRPSRRVEQERFSKSILSRPLFWCALFSVGLLGPMAVCKSDDAIAICAYAWMAGLSTAWFARGLALQKPERYAHILGMSWLLLNLVPSFAAVSGVHSDNYATHPASISPVVSMGIYMDGGDPGFPILAACFYAFLFAIGVARHGAAMRAK